MALIDSPDSHQWESIPFDSELIRIDSELIRIDSELIPFDSELIRIDSELIPFDSELIPFRFRIHFPSVPWPTKCCVWKKKWEIGHKIEMVCYAFV
jgi:hypothetical protein